MHEDIRKFSLDGMMREANIVTTKQRLVEHVETMMREYSYVPSLDIEPQFTLDYDPEHECFKFTLTCYGVKTEQENVWDTAGIMSGKAIAKHIPLNKSKQLLVTVD